MPLDELARLHNETAEALGAADDAGNPNLPDPFDQFAILEIIGHRRLGGRVREATIGGIPLIRIDAFRDGAEPVTQYYGPSAIFCLTPATEEAAQVASTFVPPVNEYQIEAAARLHADTTKALDKALAAVREIEWSGLARGTQDPCCPACGALESAGEHAENCPIWDVLTDDEIPF